MRLFAAKPRGSSAKLRGFTLIEIVLVLAIAGLILIIVFLAVSGVQKSRRDFQRKHTAAEVEAALLMYYSNHGQKFPDPSMPSSVTEFESSYMPSDKDPLTGLTYRSANGNFAYRGNGASHSDVPAPGVIYVQTLHWCNNYGNGDSPDDPIAGNDTNANNVVVWIGLEQGGSFCVDNYTK